MTPTWLLLEVTAILVLALVGVRLARKSRAAVRHVLLAGAFAVLLILPVASMVAPVIRVEVPASVHAAIAPLDLESDVPAIDDAARPAVSTPVNDAAASVGPETASWSWPSLSTLLLGVWIAGTALFLIPVLVGLWQVRTLRRSGLPWRNGGAAVGALANDAGIHRGIDVLLHESVPGPMTCGVLHPAIVLPKDAERWAPEDLTRAIVHELEHVRRVDWISHCLARVVAACYWFHPIVWIAWRQLVLEAERACDDAVLRRSEATAYADQLVVLAQRLTAASSQPQLAMANRRDLHTRVLAVLDSRQRRGRAGAVAVAIAIAACALLVVAMSPLRIVAASAQEVPNPSNKFDAVSIKLCAGLQEPRQGSGRGAGPLLAQSSPGHVYWDCVSLAELIDQAYVGADNPLLNMGRAPTTPAERPDDAPKRVRGGPSWVTSDRFTIEATASTDTINPPAGARNLRDLPAPMREALRAMLADRFQLKVRRETEQQPMYGLTVATGGLKIKPPAPDSCVVWVPGMPRGNGAPGPARKPLCGNIHEGTPPEKLARLVAGDDPEKVAAMPGPDRFFEFTSVTLEALARTLSGVMDRFVLDKTAVAGEFTFTFAFSRDDHTPGGMGPRRTAADPGTGSGPSIFKALEALGLKLEPTKGPAEYLAIDSAQKPRPDSPAFAAHAASAFAQASADKSAGTSGNTPDGSSAIQSATGQASPPKFDVVSIKPCAPAPPTGGRTLSQFSVQLSPGYAHWNCVTVAVLIVEAYTGSVRRDENGLSTNENPLLNNLISGRDSDLDLVKGLPDWARSDKFEIEARGPVVPKYGSAFQGDLPQDVRLMIRSMLQDQFQLKLRRATEERPMYVLSVAPGGLKLGPAGPSKCWLRSPTQSTPPPGYENLRPCATTRSGDPGGDHFTEYTNFSLAGLALNLSTFMDRYVLDKTGVDGRFDFRLMFAVDDHTPTLGEERVREEAIFAKFGNPVTPRAEATGPNIFKALELLGLKLEPAKGPQEFLVADSVQRPKSNQQ